MIVNFFQKTSTQKGLFILSILINLVLVVIIFATLSEKQIYTYFNSDTLYAPSVYKDLFLDKTGIKGWHLNGAPNFFPDMLLFFIIRSFFDHFIPACFTYSIVQVLLVLILLSTLYKNIFKTISFIHLSFGMLLMTMFLFVTLINEDFVYTFYVLSISYHMGAFIMLLISLILVFKYLKSFKKKLLYYMLILSSLAIVNDRLFLILFSVPLFSLILLLFLKSDNKKQIINILVINLTSIFLGLSLFRMIENSGYIQIIKLSWKVYNFSNIIPALNIFCEQHIFYLREFDFRGIINILFLISFFFHCYFLIKNLSLAIKRKEHNQKELIYLLLFISITALVLITPIVNGSYVGWAILRYNIFSFYLGIFSYAYLIHKLISDSLISKKVFNLLIPFVIFLNSFFIINQFYKKDISKGLSNFLNYHPKKVECIDKLARDEDLRFGIAEYWTAKYITMFSKENVRVYTVFDNLKPWYHVTNKNWYFNSGKGKFGNPEFNFVISNKLDENHILEKLGNPIDTLECSSFRILKFPLFEFNKVTKEPSKVK